MEDFPENYFESRLKLSKGEELESGLCEKLFTVSLKNEDKNNFILKATDGEEEYILHLKYSDYINLVERDFSKICNNFQLLFSKLKSSIENKKVVICKTSNYSLKMIFYFKRKSLSFELFPKDYTPSEVIEHLQASDIQYKASLITYDKKFEDYGDRFYIKCIIENVGTTTWDKNITSLVCLPEYSSLICNEFFFEEEVIPNEQVCIELEYLKNEELNLSPPYFTFLYLQVNGVIFDPGLVLDFNDTFKESSDNKPNFKQKTEIRKKNEKKKTKKKEKKKDKDKMNKIIDEIKDNNVKKKKNEEKTKLEEEIKDMKNANANLKQELEKQKNEVNTVQEENKQLKKKIEKLIEDNNKAQKEIEKKEKEKEKKYKEKIQNLKKKIKELEENIKVNKITDKGKDINKNEEGSISNEKIKEIKKQYQEDMNKKYANISEKMKEFQEKILNDLKQENSRILDNYIKQIENSKKTKKEKIDSKEKEYSYELLSKDLQKSAVQFETKEINFELQIKNNGNLPWPEDGKAKLVVENKNEKEIKINDIELNNLQKNQVQTLKVNLDIENIEQGTKKIILNFNVDRRNYGKPIILQLDVEENKKVKEFRELFNLQKGDYTDQLLYEKLKEADFETEEAFNNLFN